MRELSAFICGFVFALGLGFAGMTRPEKVIGFLDVVGNWDPTLAIVMASAVVVASVGFPLVLRRSRPLYGESFELPQRSAIDGRLLFGAALFGVGWGLSGYCPGPALVSLPTGSPQPITFVACMAIGMRWAHARGAA